MLRHAPWADGPAEFSIGLRPLEAEHWFEGGPTESDRKAALLAEPGQTVWREASGSRPAQEEVLALVQDATGTRIDGDDPPLWLASLLVADDLCLMEKHADDWRLTAASLCSATFFTAEEAVGKSLSALHGPVPGFLSRLLPRVRRIFDNLPPNAIVERRNWTLVNAREAHLPSAAPVRARIADIAPQDAAAALFLRVERQTVRRLPSGGALFTIRAWRDPLSALRDDPDRLSAFAAAWQGASADFRAYKGLDRYDALVAAFLADTA